MDFKNSDWIKFNDDVNKYIFDTSLEIKNLIDSNYFDIDHRVLIDYLHPNLSNYFYMNQISKKDIIKNLYNNFKFNLNYHRYNCELIDFDELNLKKNSLSLGFFHRHKCFIKVVHEEYNITELNKYKKSNFKLPLYLIKKILKILNPKILSSSLNIIFDIAYIILNWKNLSNWKNLPKNIFFTAHGIYSNQSRLISAFCKSKETNIIGMQAGMPDLMFNYFYQAHYETTLSNNYLNWHPYQTNFYKSKSFGSPLSYTFEKKNKNVHINQTTTLILPQLPIRNYPIAQSGYWEKSRKKFYLLEKNLFQMISTISDKFDNLILQPKEIDKIYYKKFVEKFNLRLDIVVNNSITNDNDNLETKLSENIIFLYPSSAMLEYINFPVNFYCLFGSYNNNIHNIDFEGFSKFDGNFKSNKLKSYISKNFKNIQPNDVISYLSKITQ
jgi:hypothetical protein